MINRTRAFLGIVAFSLLSCNNENTAVYTFDAAQNGKDAILSLPNPKRNYGKVKELNIYCDSINGKKYLNRAVLYFDISNLPTDIEIDSVFLQLYYNDESGLYTVKESGHSGNTGLIIENIEEFWEEDQVNWDNYPEVGLKKLYFEPHKVPYQDFRLDVTELVVTDNNRLKNTQGLLVRLEKEEIGNYIHVYSRENSKINSAPKLKFYVKSHN